MADDLLSARIIAFRKHVDNFAMAKLLGDCLDLARAAEAASTGADSGQGSLDAVEVREWLEVRGIKLLPWQRERFEQALGGE